MPKTTKEETKKTNEIEETNIKKQIAKVEKLTKKENLASKKTAKVNSKSTKTSSTKKVSTTRKTKATSTTNKTSSTNKKNSSSKKVTNIDFAEYYDLPYHYNQTIVKILAQTPQMLFVYWDISDEDYLLFRTKYGEDFFSKTIPVLIVYNKTMNYTFEIEINDFANSWYLPIQDANCEYMIELGRRKKQYQNTIKQDYIYVTSSNKIETPNDHILFETFSSNVTYKNVQTGEVTVKDFSNKTNKKNIQEIYTVYHLYKEIYKNELFDELLSDVYKNPSSLSSSQFK